MPRTSTMTPRPIEIIRLPVGPADLSRSVWLDYLTFTKGR